MRVLLTLCLALALLLTLVECYRIPSFPSVLKFTIGGREVKTGRSLTPIQTMNRPLVQWSDASTTDLYTVIMIDPDAPSKSSPTMANWLHWLVVNVRGATLSKGWDLPLKISERDLRTGYAPVTPPAGTGDHRYVLYLYQQSGFLNIPIHDTRAPIVQDAHSEKRAKWSLEDFLTAARREFGVELSLVAGTYFTSMQPAARPPSIDEVDELDVRGL